MISIPQLLLDVIDSDFIREMLFRKIDDDLILYYSFSQEAQLFYVLLKVRIRVCRQLANYREHDLSVF